MMFPGVFCLGWKSWYVDHLLRCLESIRRHTDAPIILADLGSRHYNAVHAICKDFQVHVIYRWREVWSRSVALNAAAGSLTLDEMTYTTTLIFTDADMLFPASWFSTVEPLLSAPGASDPDRAKVYLTRSRDLSPEATANLPVHWMPRWSDDEIYRASTLHTDLGQGGAMVIPRAWFKKVGGFDEVYQTWGGEENDLVLRAQWDGLAVEWLPEDTAWVAHQYHTRTWPTPAQVEHVRQNRAYLAERMAEQGPIIRNQN
jgi:hypothetical protein